MMLRYSILRKKSNISSDLFNLGIYILINKNLFMINEAKNLP